MKLRDTWTPNEYGVKACVWCKLPAARCVIEEPCDGRISFEEESRVAQGRAVRRDDLNDHECEPPDPWDTPRIEEWSCPECGRRWTLDEDYAVGGDGDEFRILSWLAVEGISPPPSSEAVRRMDNMYGPRCTCPCINCSNQAHWMCHGEGIERNRA